MKKTNFTAMKVLFFLKDVDVEKVVVSKKISFGEKKYKYFTVYLHNDHKVRSLHIMFPKTSAYVESYDEQTKWIQLFIEDDELLKKYNTIKSALI